MEDADDPIPAECIRLSQAFDLFYQAITPNWRDLDHEIEYAEQNRNSVEHDCNPEVFDREYEQWVEARTEARGEAEERFRSQLVIGTAIAYMRDPVAQEWLQLRQEKWALPRDYTAKGIERDFTAPGDPVCPGPKAIANGRRRPVFFKIADFKKLMATVTSPDEEAANDDAEPIPELIRRFPEIDPPATKLVSAALRAMKMHRIWSKNGGVPVVLSHREVLEGVNERLSAHGGKSVSERTVDRALALLLPPEQA